VVYSEHIGGTVKKKLQKKGREAKLKNRISQFKAVFFDRFAKDWIIFKICKTKSNYVATMNAIEMKDLFRLRILVGLLGSV
jgi:hypothetical protein